jgi:NAD(P)-dependent dehydrogenase (short-subunit alcohol dehydrogenase family)
MMKGQHGGSIVLLSSVAARHGMPNHESIATAKGGVLGLTLSAAATYAADNIRINAIAPGLVETKLTQSITNNAAMAQASANMHPLRRLGSPGDVARMAQFLLNPANDFITGQVFGVDGGLATLRPKR